MWDERDRWHGGAGRDRWDGDGERDAPGASFRQRLKAASYRALLGEELIAVLAQAAERPLSDEIGALRVTLTRLLNEEDDVARLATNVARVVTVSVQAYRAQVTLGRQDQEDMADEIVRTLEEIGKA